MTMKRILIYLVYFAVAAAVFLVLRFPHQAAAEKISRTCGTLFPGLDVSMDRVDPKFPLRLKLENPVIRLADTFTVAPEAFYIDIPVFSRPGSGRKIGFAVSLLDGEILGHVSGVSFYQHRYSGIKMDMTGLQIKALPLALEGMTAQLSFDLSGRYEVPDRQNNPAGKGGLVLSAVTGTVQNAFLNTLGISTLDFDQITLAFVQTGTEITISELVAVGRVLNAKAKGRITLTGGSPLHAENWTVSMEGSLHPQPSQVARFAGLLPMENLFKAHPEKGIPFTVTGPATNLDIAL